MSNICSLKKIFTEYSNAYSSTFNLNKYFIYSRDITRRHLKKIIAQIDFRKGTLPFSYLGVPIFIDRVKDAQLMPTIDKFLAKLAAWNGSLLSVGT